MIKVWCDINVTMIHPIKSPRRDFTAVRWDEAAFMTARHGHGRSHGVRLPFACVDDLIDSPDGATTLRVSVLSKLPGLSSLVGEIHYHFSPLPRATTTTRRYAGRAPQDPRPDPLCITEIFEGHGRRSQGCDADDFGRLNSSGLLAIPLCFFLLCHPPTESSAPSWCFPFRSAETMARNHCAVSHSHVYLTNSTKASCTRRCAGARSKRLPFHVTGFDCRSTRLHSTCALPQARSISIEP